MFDTITHLRQNLTRMSFKLMLCGILPLVAASACTERGDITFEQEENFGAIEITIFTNGANLDPDGYIVMVDEGRSEEIEINASLVIGALLVKRYDINLNDVAENCSVGVNPLIVTIVADVTIDGVFVGTCCS
ncbi:MAG: hypothetical protein IIC36_13485 [Gemmatimonadetes bacterium]|nr:hypothetical protein [Gemmatimonadota bacterium]